MRRALIACLLLAAGSPAVSASRVSVTLVKTDVDHGTMVFTVRNGGSHSVTVCLSNQLTMSLPPADHLQLAPLYWEQAVHGHWSTLIGSDVSFGILDEIAPKQSETFTVAMPNHGKYRAVLDYSDDLKIVRDCSVLYNGAYNKVRSQPVDVEQDRRQPNPPPRPELIPRHP
ncbi:MAG TPA: hypothetical protein VGN16_23330 [Acidobacteriaceae bacterium]|jgi:hypothetical protein